MKFGDSGDKVTSLQKALTRVGYPVAVDGQFGPHTEQAVKGLQEGNGLEVDGIVGHLTLTKIDQLEAALSRSTGPISSAPEVPGLDVSNWDKYSDWAAIAKAGYRFGYIKCTEGVSLKNQYYPLDFKNARANGVYRGAYHFFHPNDDARTQANFFLTNQGGLYPNDLPSVLDLEQMNGCSPQVVIAQALLWLGVVRSATKKQPVIYTDLDILSQLGHPSVFKEFPLWIAEPGRKTVSIPKPWDNWTIWQDSFTGTVPGVHGKADINVFNGTLTQLDAFARGTL